MIEGSVRKNERNPDVAYLTVKDLRNDVQINSTQDQNRCFDRDVVVVELTNPAEWPKMQKTSNATGDINNEAPIEQRVIDQAEQPTESETED